MEFIKFTLRRGRQIAAVIILMLVVGFLISRLDRSLQRTSYATGWTLLGIIGLLTCYNLRKRLSFIPILGSSRAWMQIHIYFGFVSVVVFLFHIGFRIPDGQFEFLLGTLFLFVSASGMYGLYITRVVPKKLTAVADEVVFERIPSLRIQLQNQAREIVFECAKLAPALVDFYLEKAAAFFEAPRGAFYYAVPNGRHRRALERELSNIDRYLPEDGRKPSQELKELINKKDDLDFHCAMQGRLKLWLFVHIATTYGMIIMAVFHAILVHAFHGGLR